jgi:hypothetical protein
MEMDQWSLQGLMLYFISLRFKITLGVIALLHILQFMYSFTETYPSGVTKPVAVGFVSGALVVVRLAEHSWLHHLANDPDYFQKYSYYALGTSGTLLGLLKLCVCLTIAMYIPKSTIETSWDYFNTIVLVLFEVIATILAGVGAHWPECILMGAKKGLFHSCNDRKICEMLFQKDKTRLLKLLFDKGMLLSEKEEGGGGGGGVKLKVDQAGVEMHLTPNLTPFLTTKKRHLTAKKRRNNNVIPYILEIRLDIRFATIPLLLTPNRAQFLLFAYKSSSI